MRQVRVSCRVSSSSHCRAEISSIGQFEAFFHPLEPIGQPINAFGKLCNFHVDLRKFDMNVCDLALDRANTVL